MLQHYMFLSFQLVNIQLQTMANTNERESAFIAQMNLLNDKVFHACTQVKVLNQEIDLLNKRYQRALLNERSSFRYSLRLRLATYEGVRGTLLQYARMNAHQMDEIEEIIMNERTT